MKNKVELLGYYGSDKIIAQSAWTSTTRDLTPEKLERVPALINQLWNAGHETPFEKGMVHFLVDTDIASHIHLLKHRISSFNGESARYKELKEDKYYIPEDWNNIKLNPTVIQDLENGLDWTKVDYNATWDEVLFRYNELGNHLYHEALKDLTPVLGRKRAKESARYFKTYASQIQGDVSFNMRSFANFINLRKSEHAQLEIREVANEMLELVKAIPDNPFEHTLKAMGYE